MRFISCFSGLEAASLAFGPLHWECVGVAEIAPFPCEIIRQRFPHLTNMGDVLADDFLDRVAALAPDGVVGGPPCQDFSIAGLRRGLDGDRGNLTLRWVQIIHAARARLRFALTENVPGWLSVNDGHAFGSFLAALVGADSALVPPKQCGGRWTDAGMVAGPEGRAAWRILDAQFFGLAQRRQRVFVVFCPRNGADPAAVLFEPIGLQGNPAPRRETRERVAGTLSARSEGGGGLGTDFELGGGLIEAPALARCVATREGSSQDYESTKMIACAPPLTSNPYGDHESREGLLVAHSLRGEGFDASEDGTGRGTPIVPVAYRASGNCGAWETGDKTDALTTGTDPNSHIVAFDTTQITSTGNFSSPKLGDPVHPLAAGAHAPAIAFTSKDHGADAAVELAPTLRGMGHDSSHANGGGQLAVAFDMRGREGGAQFEGPHDTANIRAASSGSSRSYVAEKWAVRRLTETECERLQGIPDNWTRIAWRGKVAEECPSGPRYKAIGNSWAIPVVAWIAKRLDAGLRGAA